ncbi:MAG: M20/M25/M40 family metallo-hydrolase [Planctomycetota bacterium]|jgi:acetylornithine deacetylase|nr:M20/M25/M40 family metallo-hydrolase [Planctomycetota bacterium]MDP7248108.1 M20/M25/M40 family metallo-hydrolase [Planctomycetota bacterium]
MSTDTVELACDLIAVPSQSSTSNVPVTDLVQDLLTERGFETERTTYQDEASLDKVSLVAVKGSGAGGIGFFAHSDTVEGKEWPDGAWSPKVENGRLIGLGACDMKGPLAAALIAAKNAPDELNAPLMIAVAADEEIGHIGAHMIVESSKLFKEKCPRFGVITEPTELTPVYAHKGGRLLRITAHGRSAHTSTDNGISANFLIAPFLAEMAELAQMFKSDTSFMNDDFDPPTNGFNMVLDDFGCPQNVTAARTTCHVGFRTMPNAREDDVEAMIRERAEKHSLEVVLVRRVNSLYTAPDSEVIRLALEASGAESPVSVPYGSEAEAYSEFMEAVVLGPGSIDQAHTVGEFVDVDQLERSVEVYGKMIERVCT